jgi:hypothetical protein
MPATPSRRSRNSQKPLREIFRHGGIELGEAAAESHRDALARVAELDRRLEALDLGATPIPIGVPWAGESGRRSHER